MVNLKKNILKIITVMLIVLAIIIPTTVRATDGSINVIAPKTTPSPTTAATASPKPTPSPKVTPTPNTNKLPQTGIEDYTGLIIATIVLGGSALFAYKKIKDYDRF